MASKSTSPFSRARLTTTLTTVQHTSALVFGTFLFVHLAAPSTAVVAKSGHAVDLASKTMILGRVYYQNFLTEPIVVYGAAIVHVAAGVAKRALSIYARWQKTWRRRPRKGAPSDVEPYRIGEPANDAQVKLGFSLPSVHTLTGILLAPVLAVHVALNRLVPSRSSSPINELSPSEMDYAFVTYGLEGKRSEPHSWRTATIIAYGVLLAAGALHVVSGTDRIAQRARARRQRRRRTEGESTSKHAASSVILESDPNQPISSRAAMHAVDARRKQMRKATVTMLVSTAAVFWLGWGLVRMTREGSGVSGFMEKRVKSVYASVWPYSVLR